MNETGFVKFNCNWINEAPLDVELIKKLNICRDKLYESGFIGVNKDGIGYGNISIRYLVPDRKPDNLHFQPEYRRHLFRRHNGFNPLSMPKGMNAGLKQFCNPNQVPSKKTGFSVRHYLKNQFIITGSATGKIKYLTNEHYTKVLEYNLDKNSLTAVGPIIASSESLTHAVIYEHDKSVNAVIHIHNIELWKKLLNKVPTTNKNIEYGTPDMAKEILRLFRETNLIEKKILIMAGHEEGIVTFGKTLDEAGKILLNDV